jgi:uncharacterized membrane protein
MHLRFVVNRKLAVIVAAIIVPGGFVALFGAWLVKTLASTERGRKVVQLARERSEAVINTVRRPGLPPAAREAA